MLEDGWAGYRYCGARTKVQAGLRSANTRSVQIEEGGNSRKGQVEVAAPQQVDRAAIVRFQQLCRSTRILADRARRHRPRETEG
jgi:hypothetical protein